MEIFGNLEIVATYLAVILVTLLAVLLPMSAYAAQKWAHKTYLETRSINHKLTELLEVARDQGLPHSKAEAPIEAVSRKRREPTLGSGQ
jgi:cobalamin biosynthesis protein CobD/CbiB